MFQLLFSLLCTDVSAQYYRILFFFFVSIYLVFFVFVFFVIFIFWTFFFLWRHFIVCLLQYMRCEKFWLWLRIVLGCEHCEVWIWVGGCMFHAFLWNPKRLIYIRFSIHIPVSFSLMIHCSELSYQSFFFNSFVIK